jgi:multiple sugar transport system permease protein
MKSGDLSAEHKLENAPVPARQPPARRFLGGASGGVVRAALVMVAPTILLVGLFTVYPYIYALWGSLQTLSPILPAKFVGLLNYKQVITSSYFVGTVKNTFIFSLVAVPAIVVLGVAVASLVNQKFLGDIALRGILLLPWAIPTAISGVIWKGVFADSWGALNAGLYGSGVISNYIEWLTTPNLAMLTVIIAHVWTQFPMAAVLTLAAMQAIPDELYEAAAIDGAGTWQRFRYVTLPGIQAMLVVVSLYEILVALTAFDITYGLTGGGPGTATTLISYFTWAESFKMLNFGRGAALAVLIALVSIVLIFGLLRAMPKDALVEEE